MTHQCSSLVPFLHHHIPNNPNTYASPSDDGILQFDYAARQTLYLFVLLPSFLYQQLSRTMAAETTIAEGWEWPDDVDEKELELLAPEDVAPAPSVPFKVLFLSVIYTLASNT